MTAPVYSSPSFAPLGDDDSYPPIEDLGLIGDGTTAGLVARDGTVVWLCLPRFDDDPLFCSLLDAGRGGSFRLAPTEILEARQRYEPDSGVLTTELRTPTGLLRITDCLTLRAGADLSDDVPVGRGELLRSAAVLDGSILLHVEVEPRGGATAERRGDGWRIRAHWRPDLDLQMNCTVALDGRRTVVAMRAGEQVHLVLRWAGGTHRYRRLSPAALLQTTLDAWRRWLRHVSYDGPQQAPVRRSAITLKMLDHVASGAMVAAPSSSLPEAIGGVRNWDYRYAWLRDAAFSVYALRRIDLNAEAWGFLAWALDAVDREGQPRVLYTLDGCEPPPEREDAGLEGYRRSAPVRWGERCLRPAPARRLRRASRLRLPVGGGRRHDRPDPVGEAGGPHG